MNAIVSVTSDWGIGYEGHLIVSNRHDMRRFRELTKGSVVICGSSTFASFPNGSLLDRVNIVISSRGMAGAEGAIIVGSVAEALAEAMRSGHSMEHVWVIGGESVYQQMIGLCDKAYVTKHDVVVPADTFFPNLDEDPGWVVAEESEEHYTPDGVRFRFVTYENRSSVGRDFSPS